MPTLFFVHGTGVRQEGYDVTIKLLVAKVAEFLPGFAFASCAWFPYGAQLNRQGDSIPDYNDTGEPLAALEASSLARWRILSEDPLLELRILPREPTLGGPQGPKVWERVRLLPSHAKVTAALKPWFLDRAWSGFLETILASGEWQETVCALTPPPPAVSDRVARALVAAFQIYLRERAFPGLAAPQRDTLRAVLIDPLGGPPAGALKDWVLERFARAGTDYGRKRRGAITDSTSPVVGDILRYQARGQEIRNFIRGELQKCAASTRGDIVLLGHSLGGVACVDLLVEQALTCVTRLITAGSQAPYFYEIDALVSRRFGEGLGDNFTQPWLNFYDPRDLLSYRAAKVFPGKAVDQIVDSRQAFPESHGAYWNNDEQFWKPLASHLNS